MKTIRLLLNLALFLVGLLVIIGCTSTQSVDDAVDDEPYYGTWVSEDHPDQGKFVLNPDGSCFRYKLPTDSEPGAECRYTFEEKWRDDEGNYYYRVLETWSDGPYDESSTYEAFNITMIDPSGHTQVVAWSHEDWPEEIPTTQTMSMYEVFYRQE
jgi:hypothetical protein